MFEGVAGPLSAIRRRWAWLPTRAGSAADARYRNLLALVPEPLFVHCDGKIVYANQAGARLLNADSPESLLGTEALDMFHQSSRPSILERRRTIAETGLPAPFKEHLLQLPAAGGTVEVETGLAPIEWEGVPAMLVAVRDISERKDMERALRRSEQRHRELIGLLPDAVLVSQDNRIVFVNAAGLALYGAASADEIVGREVFDFIHPEDRPAIEARHAMPAVMGVPLPYLELRNVRLDGTILHIESHVALFPWDGGEARIAVIRDITERRRLEDDLTQSRKMEAVGQLTGGMAHEFNNLLQAMLGYLEAIRDDDRTGADDHENFREMIDAAIRACLKGATITQSLLAFARKQPLQPHAVDLRYIVQGAMDILGSALPDTIRMHYRQPPDLWHAVVDPIQVQTCLINIVLNARDAMPDGGEVQIEAANAHIDIARATELGKDARVGAFVRLSVTDDGAGIPEALLEHVFEPFFTTKEVGQGTGLGLSMVYGFAKQSNGFVVIDSAVGDGTTVTLYLPRIEGSGP